MTTSQNAQQPQPGPIAQQLTKLQSNAHQAATPQLNGQQLPLKKDKWGFSDKTVWEWLLLIGTLLAALGAIAIPIVATIIGSNITQQIAQQQSQLSKQQHDSDQAIASDQQQATILQTYIDNIQDLLLNHNLQGLGVKSQSDSVRHEEVVELARARTLTALQGLDKARRGRLLIFLHEAKLIGFVDDTNGKAHTPIINLFNALLSGADLSDTDLSGADLGGVDLSGGELYKANLSGANLSGANLYKADLSFANISSTHLSHASLSGVRNLTQEQLDQVYTCKGAILPKGLICHHNQ